MENQDNLDISTSQKLLQDSEVKRNPFPYKDQAQAFIYYDLYDPFLFDVRDDLEFTLSPFLSAQSRRVLWGVSPLLPVIELVLIFASTQVATSILSKFGEDVYNKLKSKVAKASNKDQKAVRLIVTIVADEISVSSSIVFDNYETIAGVLKNVQQMVTDAKEKKNVNIEQMKQGSPIMWKDEKGVSTSQSQFQFHYKYDPSNG